MEGVIKWHYDKGKGCSALTELKKIVAKNISDLRREAGLTQLELAERLNYSDKAVSKWERGESVPDIAVLVEIADMFGVSLDYMVREESAEIPAKKDCDNAPKYNRRAITYIAESVAWIIAVFAFIITTLITSEATFQWLYFVYALPVVLIVKLVFNSVWFNTRHNYFIISALIWSILATIHITFLYFGINVALIYVLGAAGQIVIILWSFIRKPKKQ